MCYAVPRRDVRPLAFKLVNRFGSLSAVFSASVEELAGSGLVSESTAVLITLFGGYAMEEERRVEYGFVHSAAEAAAVLGAYFRNVKKEQVCLLCLGENGRVLFHGVIFIGDINSVRFRIRDITEPAFLCGATRVYLAHNHIKGSAFPSEPDIDTTVRLADSLASNSITLCEHFVFRGDSYGTVMESLSKRGGKYDV